MTSNSDNVVAHDRGAEEIGCLSVPDAATSERGSPDYLTLNTICADGALFFLGQYARMRAGWGVHRSCSSAPS